MNYLKLENPSNSPIPISITTYPDGQQDLKILAPPLRTEDEIIISSRMNGFVDVELIILAKKALDILGWKGKVKLYVPYFLGARSDRLFVEGGVRYLKDVIAPIINSLNFDRVIVLDPHSDVVENTVDRIQKIPFHSIFHEEIRKIENPTLVSPDGGSLKKIYETAAFMGIENILVCGKHRDVSTGKITSTVVPSLEGSTDNMVICDDICDGGRTFIELAKAILDKAKNEKPSLRLHLFITHGIFSKGLKELESYYSSIVTTDSIGSLDRIKTTKTTQVQVF